MAKRQLHPNVQVVIESYRQRKLPETIVVENVIQAAPVAVLDVEDEEPLDFAIECGFNTFWILSEDEETYELVQFPVNEGIGSALGGIIQGIKGFFNWLRTNMLDWLDRKMPGGNSRQVMRLYQQNPQAARELVYGGLAKQFQGPELEAQMRMFDAKAGRYVSGRTNVIKTLNKAKQNPNDTHSIDTLQSVADGYGGIQKAEADAKQTGQNPQAAGAQAAKKALGGLGDFFAGVTGTHPAGQGPRASMGQSKQQQEAPAKPAAQPQQPATAGQPAAQQSPDAFKPQEGDRVWAKDAKTGQTIQGTVKDKGDVATDQTAKLAWAGQLAVYDDDGREHPLKSQQWQRGNAPADGQQAAQQPAPPKENDVVNGTYRGKPVAGVMKPLPKQLGTGLGVQTQDGQFLAPNAIQDLKTGGPAKPAATTQEKPAQPPQKPAAGQMTAFAQPQAQTKPATPAAAAAQPKPEVAKPPAANAAPVKPTTPQAQAGQQPPMTGQQKQQAVMAQLSGATNPQQAPLKMAPPAKKKMKVTGAKVQPKAIYDVQITGTPVGPTPGKPGTFTVRMRGSAFLRALDTATSSGVMDVPKLGQMDVTNVIATNPATGTTTTIGITKKTKGPQPGAEPGAEPPTPPPASPPPPQGTKP